VANGTEGAATPAFTFTSSSDSAVCAASSNLGAASGVAPFPPASGASALGVIAAVMEHTASTMGDNATALLSGATSSLTILSAALLRAAAPGDPPINVNAGPPTPSPPPPTPSFSAPLLSQ
jgi:hypothetical protein